MLGHSAIRPTIPVTDLERAKKFYVEVLGLQPLSVNMQGMALLSAGSGTQVELYQRAQTKADHTVATFEVDSIDAVVQNLRDKGVRFEEYDMPEIKTQNGIATLGPVKAAWFKDPDQNILCIHQVST